MGGLTNCHNMDTQTQSVTEKDIVTTLTQLKNPISAKL